MMTETRGICVSFLTYTSVEVVSSSVCGNSTSPENGCAEEGRGREKHFVSRSAWLFQAIRDHTLAAAAGVALARHNGFIDKGTTSCAEDTVCKSALVCGTPVADAPALSWPSRIRISSYLSLSQYFFPITSTVPSWGERFWTLSISYPFPIVSCAPPAVL